MEGEARDDGGGRLADEALAMQDTDGISTVSGSTDAATPRRRTRKVAAKAAEPPEYWHRCACQAALLKSSTLHVFESLSCASCDLTFPSVVGCNFDPLFYVRIVYRSTSPLLFHFWILRSCHRGAARYTV